MDKDINILDFLKKPRKPKTKKSSTSLRKIVSDQPVNKNKDYFIFVNIGNNDILDAINDTIQLLGNTQKDLKLFKMFSILKNEFPWPLVKLFFNEFNASEENNIIDFFEMFRNLPDVSEKILKSKHLLQTRKAIPLSKANISKSLLLQDVVDNIKTPLLQNQRSTIIIPSRNFKDKKFHHQQQLNLPSSNLLIQPQARKDFIKQQPTSYEQAYREAPWMVLFTNSRIKGIAIKEKSQYATLPLKDNWYVANSNWYSMASQYPGRRFEPDKVAYITYDNNLIIETEEMFNQIKHPFAQFEKADEHTHNTAYYMLRNANIIKEIPDAAMFVSDILTSFGKVKTIKEMATKVSNILVYLEKLLPHQSYHEKIISGVYKGSEISMLNETQLIPEKNILDEQDKFNLDAHIQKQKNVIINNFYKQLRSTDPVQKKQSATPVLMHTFKQIKDKPDDDIVIQNKEELAPGLFLKLRKIIYPIINCSTCGAEIVNSNYKSWKDKNTLYFCSSECMDKYSF